MSAQLLPEVRAAGGVVLRRAPDGSSEVAIIHRPAYDDWTLPKGKLEPGESDEAAALREVEEETGFACRLGERLGAVTYRDKRGGQKVVSYWAMKRTAGSFRPGREVDELRWLSLEDAAKLLTYGHDRELLEKLAEKSFAF